MEINLKEAKSKMGSLLDRSQRGEEVVLMRRGRRIARLVPVSSSDKRLPDLKDFRDSITVKGDTLGSTVIQGRIEERY
jgi:prevent-host-death family protein